MTGDSRQTLERIADRVPIPEPAYDRFRRRRGRKERNRRVSAAVLVAVLALLSVAGLVRAFGGSARPADQPAPTPSAGIFSGLGGWIVYGSGSGDMDWIWAVDPERPGMIPRQLSNAYGEPLAWSSDGSRLLVLRTLPDGHVALYVLNADASETLLVESGRGHHLSSGRFSPDGSKVFFALDSVLYAIDAQGGTARRIGAVPVGPNVWDATFSPDASKIAYFDGGGDHDNTLRVVNADGSGSRILLRDAGMMKNSARLGNLAWFPDGQRLIFDGINGNEPAPESGIYTVQADGSGLTRLGKGSGPFFLSPDGSRIAYSTGSYDDPALVIANSDGTHVQGFKYALYPGPWNPLPYEPGSGSQGTAKSPGATRPDMITYSIAALIALAFAVLWFRRKGPAPRRSAS